MKLLDKIAKKLGYIPDKLPIPNVMVNYGASIIDVKTFQSSVNISSREFSKAINGNSFNLKRWAKRRVVEKLADELMSCMEFTEYFDEECNYSITGRIQIIDKKGD